MSITLEDLQYLPYNDHNLGRIFTRNCKENIKLFIEEFRESEFGSRLVRERLAYSHNLDAILEETQKRFGHDDVNMTEYTQTAKSLWMNGDLQPEQQEVVSVEPNVERDRLGRPLSPKAQQWKRWQEWCNAPTTSMKEIRELRRTNPEFAEFFANQSTQERSTGVGDAAQNLLERSQNPVKKVSDEVRKFVEDYRHMSSSQLKSLLSPASVGAEAAAHYNKIYLAAIDAGLI